MSFIPVSQEERNSSLLRMTLSAISILTDINLIRFYSYSCCRVRRTMLVDLQGSECLQRREHRDEGTESGDLHLDSLNCG